MTSRHEERMARFRQGVAELQPQAPLAEPAAPSKAGRKPLAEPTVPFQVRITEDLRARYVAEAARRSVAAGRNVTPQQIAVEVLLANIPGGE